MFKLSLLLFAMSPLLFTQCKKGEEQTGLKNENPITTVFSLPSIKTNEITDITTISAVSGGLTLNNGGTPITDRGICISSSPNPTIENTKIGTVSISGSGAFRSEIANLKASTIYYVRAFATNKVGTAYGNEIQFTTTVIGNAVFKVTPMFIIGSSLATADLEVINDGGDAITERGICWGLSENPTIDDNKLKHTSKGLGKFRITLNGLLEKTNYYARAYAINEKGVSYSESFNFKTIPRGKITYTFNKSASPTADQLAVYARLQFALDSAIWYVENYTSAKKHIYINYDAGVPTADANNEGWMRFGAGVGFQNLRTMLHEMDHTLGTGTSAWWNSKIVGGKFQGAHTNELLNKIQGTTAAQLSGDSQHWWPYGLNQNSEVNSSWDYVYNCILIEAMRKDGLTSHSGAYTP